MCYNRLLAQHLAVALVGHRHVTVATFHRWAVRCGVDFNEDEEDGAFGERLLARLQGDTGLRAVLIDEAQDWPCSWFQCARLALKEPETGDLMIVGGRGTGSVEQRNGTNERNDYVSLTPIPHRGLRERTISGHPQGLALITPSTVPGLRGLGLRLGHFSNLEVAAMMQHAPGDARQLVSERDRQHVVVKSFGCGLDPGLEAVALPVRGSQQHDTGGLHDSVLRYLLPRLDILPRIVRSPVEICFGTRPSQAPKSRPLQNTSPVPIAATVALEIIGPMPGTVINRSQPASSWASTPRRGSRWQLPYAR